MKLRGNSTMKYETVFDMVGNTPIVKIGKLNNATMWVKLEGANPTGSLKDRTVLHVLQELQPKQKKIIDASSGSHACSLAYWGKVLGYEVTTVVNSKLSPDNETFLAAMGARIVKYGATTSESRDKCIEIMGGEENDWFFFDQLTNVNAPTAHQNGTAAEIFSELENVSAVVGSKGSGVTLTGVSRYITEHRLNTKIFGSCAILGDKAKLAGTYLHGVDFETDFIKELALEPNYQDIQVGFSNSMTACLNLNKKGIPVGPQGGGVYLAAIHAIQQDNITGNVVLIAGDTILKNAGRFKN